MLSISPPRSAGAATSYYLHLEKDSMGKVGEYYAAEDTPGQWMGSGAKTLGLEGAVSGEDFATLCKGYDQNLKPLMRNAGDQHRRAGWDLTFSTPKSVSVAWSVADESTRIQIEAAHQKSVEASFAFMQDKCAFARTGAQGRTLLVGGLVAAAFQHGTSREQDAQLHTHVFVMNSVVREDGTAASLSSEKLFEYKMTAGAAYQCSLAHELNKLGYQLVRDGEASFRIASVPKALEKEQSTRRQQIESEMASNGSTGAKAAAIATLVTRAAKKQTDLASLRARWKEQAIAHGFGSEQARPQHAPRIDLSTLTHSKEEHHAINNTELHQAKQFGLPERYFKTPARLRDLERIGGLRTLHGLHPMQQRALDDQLERPNPDQVLSLATKHDAILHEAKILMHAFRASISATSLQEAIVLAEHAKSHAVPIERSDGTYDRRGQAYTTTELIRAERDVIRIATHRQGERAHLLNESTISRAAQQSAEAKGYELNAEQRAALKSVAGHGGGVSVLVGDAGTGKSTTMFALREAYESSGFRVIGTSAGGKQSAELMQSAGIESRNLRQLESDLVRGKDSLTARTVVVLDEAGMTDSRQMAMVMRQAAEAGAKVVLVGDHKQLQPVGAGETFRRLAQRLGAARLEDNQRQRSEWERHAVKQMSQGQSHSALASYILNDRVLVAKTFDKAIKEVAKRQLDNIQAVGLAKTVAIAGTNVSVKAINTAVRDGLKSLGQLQNPTILETKHAQIEVAVGERVVIGSSGRKQGFENGDAGTVELIGGRGQLEIRLDRTGQTGVIDAKKVDLAHGYAITTHKSQGATYERATVYLTSQTSREMAYVQSSRARESTHFVTSSHHLKAMGEPVLSREQLREFTNKFPVQTLASEKSSCLDFETKGHHSTAANDKAWLDVLAKAMSQERPKESTLDYRLVERSPTSFNPSSLQISGEEADSKFTEALDRVSQAIERDRISHGRDHDGLDPAL
jgi:conjugative relaxase-like TrwC/TraI family protein